MIESIVYVHCTSLFVRIIFVLDWCMLLVQAHQSIVSRSIVWYLLWATFAHAVIFAWQIWIICTVTSAFMYLLSRCKYFYIVNLLIRNYIIIEIVIILYDNNKSDKFSAATCNIFRYLINNRYLWCVQLVHNYKSFAHPEMRQSCSQ